MGWHTHHTAEYVRFSYIQTTKILLSANCLNFSCPALESLLELFHIKSVVWFSVFLPLCVTTLPASQKLNYYGCLATHWWKRHLMWYAEGFILLSLMPDQIFLSVRMRELFSTTWKGFNFPWIWDNRFLFLFTLLTVISVIPFWSE